MVYLVCCVHFTCAFLGLQGTKDLLGGRVKALRAALVDLVERRNTLIAHAADMDNALREEKQRFAARQVELQQAEARVAAEKEALQARIAALERDLTSSKSEVISLTEELGAARAAVVAAEGAAASSKSDLSEANAALEEYEDKVTQLEGELAAAQAANAAQKAQLDAAIKDLGRSAATASKGKQELEGKLAAATATAQATIQQLTQERDALDAEGTALKQQLESMKAELVTARASADMAGKEHAILKETTEQRLALLQERNSTLEEDLKSARAASDAKDTQLTGLLQTVTQIQATANDRSAEDKLQTKLESVSNERDELRSSLMDLRGDLRQEKEAREKFEVQATAAEADAATAKAQLETTSSQLATLGTQLADTKAAAEAAAAAAATCQDELEEKAAKARSEAEAAGKQVGELTHKLSSISGARDELAAALKSAQTELASVSDRASELESEVAAMQDSVGASSREQMSKLVAATKEAESLKRRMGSMGELQERLGAADERIAFLEEQVFAGEMTRRALHNTIQDLRGNIRVYVRLRPFLGGDAPKDGDLSLLKSSTDTGADGKSVTLTAASGKTAADGTVRPAKASSFSFDGVFDGDSTQEQVFKEVGALVQSALDGYNVCLFSYGQTGSGKTHTMIGGSGQHAGLIPRSITKILAESRRMNAEGWSYSLEASFLEIYNESIKDLLLPGGAPKPKKGFSASGSGTASASSLSVVHHDNGTTEVPGLTRVPVDCADDIEEVLQRAAKNRSVARTDMNEVSSRSHSVFTLHIRGEHEAKSTELRGTLNLCDLAGSERVGRSGAEGARLKEAGAINKSLSALGEVFQSLNKKTSHVPFRNSKLTYLLQPCFQGDGKTLMLVNLSPTQESASESLCSLRFAAQVSQVHLGQASRQISSSAAAGSGGGSGRASTAPGSAAKRRMGSSVGGTRRPRTGTGAAASSAKKSRR